MSATAYACLGTNNHLAAANSTTSFLTSQFSTEIGNAGFLQSQLYTAQGSIWSLNQQVLTANGDATTLSYEFYAVAALAAVSLGR